MLIRDDYIGTNFYKDLGVEPDASLQEIKSAYKKQALKWHPDKNPARAEEARVQFEKIQNAYEILSDEKERSIYDLVFLSDVDAKMSLADFGAQLYKEITKLDASVTELRNVSSDMTDQVAKIKIATAMAEKIEDYMLWFERAHNMEDRPPLFTAHSEHLSKLQETLKQMEYDIEKNYLDAIVESALTKNFYEILGVPKDADKETIEQAYKNHQASLEKATTNPIVSEHVPVMRYLIETAYTTLANDESRHLYNQTMPTPLNYIDAHGNTPLHFAVQNDKSDFVMAVLKTKTANVELKNQAGLTPLQMALDQVEAAGITDRLAVNILGLLVAGAQFDPNFQSSDTYINELLKKSFSKKIEFNKNIINEFKGKIAEIDLFIDSRDNRFQMASDNHDVFEHISKLGEDVLFNITTTYLGIDDGHPRKSRREFNPEASSQQIREFLMKASSASAKLQEIAKAQLDAFVFLQSKLGADIVKDGFSRRNAADYLKNKPRGSFVLRPGPQPGKIILTINNQTKIEHFTFLLNANSENKDWFSRFYPQGQPEYSLLNSTHVIDQLAKNELLVALATSLETFTDAHSIKVAKHYKDVLAMDIPYNEKIDRLVDIAEQAMQTRQRQGLFGGDAQSNIKETELHTAIQQLKTNPQNALEKIESLRTPTVSAKSLTQNSEGS